ncbi:hypothetical protein CRYUN_Cryun01aG0088700 [Craigia yunnanensis]
MERLVLACGGEAVNSVDDLTPYCLGWAGLVYEHVLGEDKYTFVENVKNPHSCTILIKGPNDHTIAQIKDAVCDGLRAVKNTIEDEAVVLNKKEQIVGSLSVPNWVLKLLLMLFLWFPRHAENFGLDTQDVIIGLTVLLFVLITVYFTSFQKESMTGNIVGLNHQTGDPMDPQMEGIFDNYSVKRQIINSGPLIASQLLLVDEVIRAGRNMQKPP